MRTAILATVALFGTALSWAPASAQTEAPLFTDQIRGVLVQPNEARHQPIHEALQERDVLGLVRSILSPLRLPRQLSIEVKGCDGNVDTYFGDGVVTLCYEYIELLQAHSPKVGTPGGVARSDALFGAIIDTLLHEAGHGVFDLLEIPVLGREEDAADFFSAYIMLQLPPEHASRLFEGVAFMFASEARAALAKPFGINAYAGEHGLAPQRYYNFLCMAYGSDPRPSPRQPSTAACRSGATTAASTNLRCCKRAFDKLIGPHIDGALSEKTRAELRIGWRPLLSLANGRDANPLGDWMMRSGADDSQTRPGRH